MAIAAGIRSCRILVLLLSSHSHRSKQIAREAELADRNGLSIVTFRLEAVDPPEALEYFLTNLQWIDGFDSNFETGLGTLLHTVRWRLNLPETAAPAPRSRPVVVTNTPSPKPRSRKRKIWIAVGLSVGVLWLIGYALDENNQRNLYNPAAMPVQQASDPARNVGRPSAPADPAAIGGERVAGTWTGTYYCNGMGYNQMQLTIAPAGGDEVNAVMQFAVPTGASGTYDMHGMIEPGTNVITLNFTKWRYAPPGMWIPANLQGMADTANGVIKGRVLSAVCGGFEVHRQ